MTLQVSTATKEALLAAMPALFTGGFIRVFSGAQPATSDDAETGILLGTISREGFPPSMGLYAGLKYEQEGPFIINSGAFAWSLRVANSGVAAWFRVIGPAGDDGLLRYDLPRIDGSITEPDPGTGQLILPSNILIADTIVTPISFLYTIPPIV